MARRHDRRGPRGALALVSLLLVALLAPWRPSAFVVETLQYGKGPAQIADLLRPSGEAGNAVPRPRGVAVLIHGGFWKAGFNRSLMVKLAQDLVARGLAVWNIEYRTVGALGGYPETFEDVSLALDWLASHHARDRGIVAGEDAEGPGTPVALIGHSAGGHLASWLALRPFANRAVVPGPPGPVLGVRPRAVISQAGVVDMKAAYEQHLGFGAVSDLLGTPPGDSDARLKAAMNGAVGDPFTQPAADADERYKAADPAALARAAGALGDDAPLFGLVHGTDDLNVPLDQSERFQAALREAGAGGRTRLRVVRGEGHFEHLETESGCWTGALELLSEAFGAEL